MVKALLVGLLLALGALNLVWLRPRLGRQEMSNRWLRRLVAGEVVLALLVLLAVGTLASMEPAGLTFQDTVEGGGYLAADRAGSGRTQPAGSFPSGPAGRTHR